MCTGLEIAAMAALASGGVAEVWSAHQQGKAELNAISKNYQNQLDASALQLEDVNAQAREAIGDKQAVARREQASLAVSMSELGASAKSTNRAMNEAYSSEGVDLSRIVEGARRQLQSIDQVNRQAYSSSRQQVKDVQRATQQKKLGAVLGAAGQMGAMATSAQGRADSRKAGLNQQGGS